MIWKKSSYLYIRNHPAFQRALAKYGEMPSVGQIQSCLEEGEFFDPPFYNLHITKFEEKRVAEREI